MVIPGIGSELMLGTSVGGNDYYTKLLLHFGGTEGSTTVTDSSPYLKGNGTVSGDATITVTQSKFGGSSFLSDVGAPSP